MSNINKRRLKKPSFIIIGAMKSGTTSLYHYLNEHPGIFMPKVKELNHFINIPNHWSFFQGPNVTFSKACRLKSDYHNAFEDAPQGSLIGEIGHIYLYAPETPTMIKTTIENPKIIAIIRNPVERAFSHFSFHKKLGMEPTLTFEESLDIEDKRIKGSWDPIYYYVRGGFYGKQLARYYAVFPKKDIKVYKFETFFNNTSVSLADLYGFIGANSEFTPNISKKYVPGGDPRKIGHISMESHTIPTPKPVTTETRNRLINLYSDDIRITERLTGLDLSDWLEQDFYHDL